MIYDRILLAELYIIFSNGVHFPFYLLYELMGSLVVSKYSVISEFPGQSVAGDYDKHSLHN